VKYYKGYRAAGTTTFVIGLLSPLAGLIPAIACSSSKPKQINMDYPSEELMKNQDYFNGYSKTAKKIKSQKVWTNLGIAFGINVIAVLIFNSSN
jgi:hypothetical protein